MRIFSFLLGFLSVLSPVAPVRAEHLLTRDIERSRQEQQMEIQNGLSPRDTIPFRVKYFFLFPPNASRPECPENSAYYAEQNACKCFAGYFATSATAGSCRKNIAGSELCHERFGAHTLYQAATESCTCITGYVFQLTNEGLRCMVPSQQNGVSAEKFTVENTSGKFDLELFPIENASNAVLHWDLVLPKDRQPLRHYRVRIETAEMALVKEANIDTLVRKISFAVKKDQVYHIRIEARDIRGRSVANAILQLQTDDPATFMISR